MVMLHRVYIWSERNERKDKIKEELTQPQRIILATKLIIDALVATRSVLRKSCFNGLEYV